MKNGMITRRILSIVLALALVAGYIPAVSAATRAVGTVSAVADPGTASAWETMMGTDADGNRYAGRVWADKSVYKNGDTAVLNTSGQDGSTFQVELEEDEAFQIVFSVLGSTMTTTETSSTTGPMDVVLVLDTSTSMDDEDSQGVTRLERTVAAANKLLSDLLSIPGMRIAIVTYNNDSETVLPLAQYDNGITLEVTNYYNDGRAGAGVVTAYDNSRNVLGKDSGYTQGTNLQSGIDRGFNILANATNIEGRVPVAIVLTDGQANRASQEGFYEIQNHNDKDGTSNVSARNLYLSTLLNAAYTKTKIEANYGKDATVYSVGVDITTNTAARLLMNPADTSNKGFNASNTSNDVKRAYENFNRWKNGETVTYSGWTFDHNYPTMDGKITDAAIAENIYYVDTYYDVSSANLGVTFDQIYQELSSGVFNPISSSTTASGGTGVEDTPLIFVDFIGQHMQIKEIQAVTLFGTSYSVIPNADGTYTVEEATGVNPTTNESWNTRENIRILVTQETADTQRLEIQIDQQILPILLEKVVSNTVAEETTATITEIAQSPLRVYYTVGVAESVLLPNGEVDVSKLQGYGYINDNAGTVDFYSNRFGDRAPEEGKPDTWNTHVGFQPAETNRYYYHQTNQGIFTGITNSKTGEPVTIPDNAEYGIVWDEEVYSLTWMSYDEYLAAQDTDRVYTYVSYYHPTPSQTDAANASEKVTYLVYTQWQYLKESAAFYDATAEKYINADGSLSDQGVALAVDQVASVVDGYIGANPGADIYAVLGVGSLRTSRLHNMAKVKTENLTGTNSQSYAPQYTYATASDHHGNDVVVWLGNNGKLTVSIDTGIALTKNVTEVFGNAGDTYELTVTVPAGVAASPVVLDENGNAVDASYANNVLTVKVKAGQTVYISGIPGGTECAIGENINGDYYIAQQTATVRVPLVSEVLNGADQYAAASVTNAPYKYGNLYINKAITSDHAVPQSVLETAFPITVNVGAALAGKTFTVEDSAHTAPYQVTVDAKGDLFFSIKATQTLEIFDLPQGTNVTVTEADPGSHFAVSYGSRNHSGQALDSDNAVVIPSNGAASVVITNHYTPEATSVDLDVVVNKNFADASVAALLEGGTFTFLVQEYDAANNTWNPIANAGIAYGAGEYGEKSYTIENVLSGKTFTEVGTYSYKVEEVKGDVVNVSYDRAVYNFDVVVTDNGGVLSAKVIDRDNRELTDTLGDGALDYVTAFTNTYATAPISMDIQKVVKNLSGDNTVSAAGFKFKSIAVNAQGEPIDPGAAETSINTIYSDAAGVARISGVYTTEQKGTHYYIVYEENTGKAGWTYSQAQYFVTVVVDDSTGKLTAEMTIVPYNQAAGNEPAPAVTDSNKGQLTFTNVYDPEDVSVDLDAFVRKELTGKTLEDDQFTFYVYADGDRTNQLLYGTNKRNGDVNFVDFNDVLLFDKAGTYRYDIVEEIPDDADYDEATGEYVRYGMRYDATIYDLVVEVTNDEATGNLTYRCYFEDSPTNVVTFRNRYTVSPTQYALGGVKQLYGRAVRAGEFRFSLYKGQELIETVSNHADGTFRFSPITYTEAGDVDYTIQEDSGSVPGVHYTGVQNPVEVTVSVTDEDGQLVASANKANANIRFVNTYSANAARVTFTGTKTLVGGGFADGDFTFRLYQTKASFDITDASWSAYTTNQGAGYTFDRTFHTPGTYFFVVTEDDADPIENVVYDRTQHRFIVQVTDLGDGRLRASVINAETGVANPPSAAAAAKADFVNAMEEQVTEKEVYRAGSTVTHIDGQKVHSGDELTYFITYHNYNGEDAVVDIMDTIPAYTAYVEGSASHNATYAGDHLHWVLHVPKGQSVTVSFNVKVIEDEAIFTNTAVVRDGVNIYYTNEVVNHTVNNKLKKDVYLPEDVSASIDGKKVYAGDTLVYKLRFTNASGEIGAVTITDTIPENVTYVEGSADAGGVYDQGKLTWNIQNIPAWATVTVTFKVAVNEDIGAAMIQNQAKANDGENDYESRWVSNYTVEDVVYKTVVKASAPETAIDGVKVYAGDELRYTISYKNTAREKVTVNITDTVPAYTSYVANSADNGGVYDQGKLTWVLEVEAGGEVTVSFKVRVNEVDGTAITNTATVAEGRNSYATNAVSNPTDVPEEPTEPGGTPGESGGEPGEPEPKPDTPITGDSGNVTMWYTLMFVGCLGLAALVLTGKKEETENG